jgi:dTDP-4-dehydrorhamnose 3,5-epimerase
MNFRKLAIRGSFLIEPEPLVDHRGFFTRIWCRDEFASQGITRPFDQSSLSHNAKRGTLRGLHFQTAPHEEAKLVSCPAGAIFDVIVDLRPSSPTFTSWVGVEISANNHKMVYVPEGCAHGFQALADCSDVVYQISGPFHPESAGGLRWNDPDLAIAWPVAEPIMSERDANLPFLSDLSELKEAV